MGKTIVFIHGRSFKPPRRTWRRLWNDAVVHGIERDFPDRREAFEAARKEFVYFGDISNAYLSETLGQSVPRDTRDLELTLARLKRYNRPEFRE